MSHNPPTGVLPAGAHEVSAATAAFFAAHAQEYQAISAHGAAFHSQFVQSLQQAAVGISTDAFDHTAEYMTGFNEDVRTSGQIAHLF